MNEMFTNIANELVEILPQNWAKCFFYTEITEKNYKSAFYMFFDDFEKPFHCNELLNLGVSSEQIQNCFENIYKVLKPFWQLSAKDKKTKWSNCTFILTCDGDFNLETDNTDLNSSEALKTHRQNWKKKYLNVYNWKCVTEKRK